MHDQRRSQSRNGRRLRSEPRSHHTLDPDVVRLFGIHAVEAALLNPARKILRLHLTENAGHRLAAAIATRGAKPTHVTPAVLDQLLGPGTVHQGVCLETRPLEEPALEALAERAATAGPLLVLDQVTDPHNVGAILRSAAAFGASGLVMTRRHSPPLAGTLAKSASGGLEHVPGTLVPNLAQALTKLAGGGMEILGLDGEASECIEQWRDSMPVALVLGAEGRGLRRLTRELCSRLVRITTPGPLASLNVSNAAAIALHVMAMARSQT